MTRRCICKNCGARGNFGDAYCGECGFDGVIIATIPDERETALLNFYSAERRAGADPLTANERMHEFAKRLDALAQERAVP